jgi:soluble lytic murein transglycosylase-like protein
MKKRFVTAILATAMVLVGLFTPLTTASIIPTEQMTEVCLYDTETITFANKISRLEKKYYLEYKSPSDLLETCEIIKKASHNTDFDKYDVAAIVIAESRFKSDALNKKDGGVGLMQLTGIKKYHKDTLYWMTDPKDKHQNIIGGLIILEEMHAQYKTKAKAIKHYNGSTYKSELYRQKVMKIKREIIKA